jgi:peptidoglycan/xylan/chitin deacetylase (PgdA/CDA1 family)
VTLFNKSLRGARRLAKAAFVQFLFVTGSLRRARMRAAGQGVVAITLHRVLADGDYNLTPLQPGMAVRASTFERFLDYLTRYCECVLPENADRPQSQETSSRRPRIALTFDDGWKDNFDVAFPISRKYGVRFTVFLCPQMMNGREAFWTTKVLDLWCTAQKAGKLDVLRALCRAWDSSSADSLIQSLKHVPAQQREGLIVELQASFKAPDGHSTHLLTWSDVKDMSQGGISFGSHTDSHTILTGIPRDEVIHELAESKRTIEAKLNACRWFAYPNGDWSPSVRALVEQSGYQAAFTNAPGIWRADGNRFSIPRVNVWEGSLIGFNGRFSRMALEYAVFWKAHRASSN